MGFIWEVVQVRKFVREADDISKFRLFSYGLGNEHLGPHGLGRCTKNICMVSDYKKGKTELPEFVMSQNNCQQFPL